MSNYIQKIERQLQEIEKDISFREELNYEVSIVPVGWHLSHSLKVINVVVDSLHRSNPIDYRKEFSFRKTLIFLIRHFPRGKAKSPKSVLPPDTIDEDGLQAQLREARQKLNTFGSLDRYAHFKHPYFKNLNSEEAQKFLVIHTHHHLKIIRDILR